MSDGILLQATRGRLNEEWRFGRLAEVLVSLPEPTRARLSRLRDHKGSLEVHWVEEPTIEDYEAVRGAWEAQDEFDVLHYNGRSYMRERDLIRESLHRLSPTKEQL